MTDEELKRLYIQKLENMTWDYFTASELNKILDVIREIEMKMGVRK